MFFLIYLFATHCFITGAKTGSCQNKNEIAMLASLNFIFIFLIQPMIIVSGDKSDYLEINVFILITYFLITEGK